MEKAFEDKNETRPKCASDFATHDEYLSSMVTDRDLFYLEDVCMARKAVEFGCTGDKDPHSLEQFRAEKAKYDTQKAILNMLTGKALLSSGKVYTSAILRALQMREDAARIGKNCCIFFIRDHDEHGHEISGYIDYSHRLNTEDMSPIFEGEKKFLPRTDDISFFNWSTGILKSKNSPNYEVMSVTQSGQAMKLRNKRDHKVLNLEPTIRCPGGNSSRTIVPETDYLSVIVFDHYNRRRT